MGGEASEKIGEIEKRFFQNTARYEIEGYEQTTYSAVAAEERMCAFELVRIHSGLSVLNGQSKILTSLFYYNTEK